MHYKTYQKIPDTEIKLFKDLLSAFRAVMSIPSQSQLYMFFTRREEELLAESTISEYIHNRRHLAKEYLERIQSNSDWSSSGSIFSEKVRHCASLHEKLIGLHKEYLPEVPLPKNCNNVLGNLIRLCFCGDYRFGPEPCFDPDTFTKKSDIKKLIRRDDILEKVQAGLEQSGRVILSGGVPMGKTCLAKYFYYENFKKSFTDFFHIEYRISLDNSLKKIKWKAGHKNGSTWKLLLRKNQDSLLFIDSMDCESERMERELERLARLPLKIIIATRADTRTVRLPDNFSIVEVSSMNNSQLLELYQKDNPDIQENCDTLKELYRLLDGNPMAVTFAAKIAAENHYSVQELFTILKNTEIKTVGKLPKLKYNGKNLSYFSHIQNIYKNYLDILSKDERKRTSAILSRLSCLGNALVPRTLLIHWINTHLDKQIQPLTDTELQRFIDIGICSDPSPGMVQMQRLLADAVFSYENPDYKSCQPFINNIWTTIEDFRYDLERPDIQEAVHESVCRLSPSVKPYHNAGQKTESENQEVWWLYVQDCIIYLLSLEETTCAAHMLDYIYTVKKEPILHPCYVFKMALDFHKDWIDGRSDSQLASGLEQIPKHVLLNKDFLHKNPLGCNLFPGYLASIMFDKLNYHCLVSVIFLFDTPSSWSARRGMTLHGESLKHLYECMTNSGYCTGEECTYYKFIYEYLQMDRYTLLPTIHLAEHMLLILNSYKPRRSISIKYLCNLIALYSICILLSAADGNNTAGHQRYLNDIYKLKDRLDSKVLSTVLLPKTISKLCAAAYYYYAFALKDAPAVQSAKKMAVDCYVKTANLPESDISYLDSTFEELLKTDPLSPPDSSD